MEPQRPVFTVEPPTAPSRGPAPRPASGFFGGITALVLVIWKFGATGLSMLFMIWVYSNLWGWKFAAGFVGLIFVHEMGHVFAAMALGIPVSAPIFIPFLGASIVMRQNPRDAMTEALMAYAGPLAGGVGSWVCLWVGQNYDLPWVVGVAFYSFFINLFNLIPVPPLDGGRVCAAVSRWFWVFGIGLLLLFIAYFGQWTMLVLLGVIVLFAFRRIRDDFRYRHSMQEYYRIPLAQRAMVAVFYVALAGVLFVGLRDAGTMMPDVSSTSAKCWLALRALSLA